MGQDKATLPHPTGGTFLQHAINRLRAVCDGVVVSGRTSQPHNEITIDDALPYQGPASGIAASLKYAGENGCAACLYIPVDVPNLTANELAILRDKWHTETLLTLARSVSIEPLIGIYPVNLAEEIATLSTSADRSLIRWINSQSIQVVSFPSESCHNINTLKELENVNSNAD